MRLMRFSQMFCGTLLVLGALVMSLTIARAGAPAAPAVTFCGIEDHAASVVFVSDASGSMMQKFDPLRVELRAAVEGLSSGTRFGMIFFGETNCAKLDAELLPADRDNKAKAEKFANETAPRGSTDPIPGLRAAFALKPQAIYLLTDGDFPDNEAVVQEIHKLNETLHCRIHTVAFMDRGESYEKILQQISKESGGQFRYLSEEALDKLHSQPGKK